MHQKNKHIENKVKYFYFREKFLISGFYKLFLNFLKEENESIDISPYDVSNLLKKENNNIFSGKYKTKNKRFLMYFFYFVIGSVPISVYHSKI